MGHDHHFLARLDRAARDHVEFALGLYRDHEALRFVLGRLRLEPEIERVALSLDAGERGPWAVVARSGAFVTCLGQGMSTGALPVVSRARLDALLAKHRDQRARDSARELETRTNETMVDFFKRLFSRADALTREELVALSSLQPLLARDFFQTALDSAAWVIDHAPQLRSIEKLRGSDLANARTLERQRWLAGHMLLVSTMGDRHAVEAYVRTAEKLDLSLTVHFMLLASNTIALRAAWAAARIGKPLLPLYRKRAATTHSFGESLDVALPVLAIALRHEALADDARRVLAAMQKSPHEPGLEVRRTCAENALAVLDGKVSYELALRLGRERFIAITRHLPEGDPYRFDDASAVPDDLAITTALEDDSFYLEQRGMASLFGSAPLLARARAEDFYFERAVATRVIFETAPDELVDYVRRLDEVLVLAPSTVRAEPKPGRNDPCSCGSGKKFKKCCAA